MGHALRTESCCALFSSKWPWPRVLLEDGLALSDRYIIPDGGIFCRQTPDFASACICVLISPLTAAVVGEITAYSSSGMLHP